MDRPLCSKSIHSPSLLQTEPNANHSYFFSKHPSRPALHLKGWLFQFSASPSYIRGARCQTLCVIQSRWNCPHQTCAHTGVCTICISEVSCERHHNLVSGAHHLIGFQCPAMRFSLRGYHSHQAPQVPSMKQSDNQCCSSPWRIGFQPCPTRAETHTLTCG